MSGLTSWVDSEGSGADETFGPGKEHADCVAALAAEKIVHPDKCMNSRTLEVVECPKAEFKLGPKGSKHSAGYVAFECGEKKLGAVTSVATEGSKARVKYTRLVALDDALLGRLAACSLKKPDAGRRKSRRRSFGTTKERGPSKNRPRKTWPRTRTIDDDLPDTYDSAMDTFAKHLVEMVRQLPDEAILELVKNHLEQGDVIGEVGKVATSTSPPANKPRAKAKRRRRSSASRAKLKDAVLEAVTTSDGVAVSDVAKAVGAPKPRVSTVLRALRDAGEIHQAGDRRFARYGRTKAIARAASKRAKKG